MLFTRLVVAALAVTAAPLLAVTVTSTPGAPDPGVAAGQTLLVLEAMKMEHPMNATSDGVVTELRVALGDQVQSGSVLLVVEAAPDRGEGDS